MGIRRNKVGEFVVLFIWNYRVGGNLLFLYLIVVIDKEIYVGDIIYSWLYS